MQPQGGSTSTSVGLNINYFASVFGILRCVEVLFAIIAFSTAAANNPYWGWPGMGFVVFVGVMSMLGNLAIIALRFFNVFSDQQTQFSVAEIIYSGVFSLLYLISGIIAAAYAGDTRHYWSSFHGRFAASATFCFFNVILYGFDAGFRFLKNRQS